MKNIENKKWWTYLDKDLQELLSEAFLLLERVKNWDEKFHDYSFVVFPAAKAYEGFLKNLFFDMGFISKEDYYGKHFRIGKALNPTLDVRFRDGDWVYEKLTKFCNGPQIADKLWITWKKARNVTFHWFPEEANVVNLKEAEERLNMVVEAIDIVFRECEFTLAEKEKKGKK